ncbi:MAG TPA: hypothetical protein VEU62_22375, partial [Bryobacterales bacterium]|nr:hypothetical protein [Bryobacterales bacterium]
FLLAGIGSAPLLAQIIPYPGGGYPGGGYPGGYPGGGRRGPGFPFPRRGGSGPASTDRNGPLANFRGTLRKLEAKTIVVEPSDSRVLEFERSRKTKFYKESAEAKASDFKPGDYVSIDATRDEMGTLHAVNVRWEKAPPADVQSSHSPGESTTPDADRPVLRHKDQPAQAEPPAADTQTAATAPAAAPGTRAPAAMPEPGADRPVLRRRDQPATAEPAAPSTPTAASASRTEPETAESVSILNAREYHEASEVGRSGDPVIEKARQAAGAFSETLPNYVCQEFMSRFATAPQVQGWQPIDVVSSEVVYENGHEDYRNLAINGKPVKKGMEQMTGSWSTGEFGTILQDLLSPATAADFRVVKQATINGQAAVVYDFQVEREHSHWHIQVASQAVIPAYRGSVWIDKTTGRVLRIEMEARAIPEAFPTDKVETAVDYDYVHIGTQRFLLPVHAETLSCRRGSRDCSRNVLDFRNCHKYSSDADITFEQPK